MKAWTRRSSTAVLGISVVGALIFGACERNTRRTQEVPTIPSVRLYLASTLAGAMEPCGCRKDMLGGVDHAAALIEKGKAEAPNSVVLGAGPLFFMDPGIEASNSEKDQQDRWKADTIASAVAKWGLLAWAPGVNDFGRGAGVLAELSKSSGALPVAANLSAKGVDVRPAQVVERGGVRVGIAGVSLLGLTKPIEVPADKPGGLSTAVELQEKDAQTALRAAQQQLTKQGATVQIALIAAPRGAAMRLLEAVPGFHVAVIGKQQDAGDTNDAPVPPTLLGSTLVVQGPNHLQAMPIVDLFIRDGKGDTKAGIEFEDASGVDLAERRATLQGRIVELTKRVDDWKALKTVNAADLAARQADLTRMKTELQQLPEAKPPREGSFFRYDLREVREALGADPAVSDLMRSYYKEVNDYNKVAFKDRKPVPAPKGTASFVGGAQCESCHEEATAFWKTTGHAKAYKTLADDFKEFNLDCVGCHVTGYEMPGGSTVTFVDGLKDVQCETCHGAGSFHVKDEDAQSITLTPPQTLCSKCHHQPHVADDWDVKQAWPHIIGPGHGAPVKAHAPGQNGQASEPDAGTPVPAPGAVRSPTKSL